MLACLALSYARSCLSSICPGRLSKLSYLVFLSHPGGAFVSLSNGHHYFNECDDLRTKWLQCPHHHHVSTTALSHRTDRSFISAMSSFVGLSPSPIKSISFTKYFKFVFRHVFVNLNILSIKLTFIPKNLDINVFFSRICIYNYCRSDFMKVEQI